MIMKNEKSLLLFLCGLTFIIRIFFLVFAPSQYKTFGDTAEYIEVAQRLCSTGSYPFEHLSLPTFRAPGLPLYIAGVSGCFTLPHLWLLLSFMIVDSVSCGIGMLLVKKLSNAFCTLRAGLFGLIYALYPLFIQQTVTIQSEVLTIFCMLLFLFLLLKSYKTVQKTAKTPHLLCWSSGVLLACAILTRPSALLTVVFLAGAFLISTKPVRGVTFFTGIGVATVLIPWSLFATISTGKLVLVNDSFCYSIYRGARLELFDVYAAPDRESFLTAAVHSEDAVRSAEQGPESKAWCRSTLALFAQYPREQAQLAVTKLWAFFRPWPHSGAHSLFIVYGIGSIVSALYCAFLLSLFQESANTHIKTLKWFVALFILAIGIFHMPHQVSNRYRVPFVDPFLLLTVTAFLRIPSQNRTSSGVFAHNMGEVRRGRL
jgi:4-amino-4-deoxy-L-arabinose transferase-like glycosyltransferase